MSKAARRPRFTKESPPPSPFTSDTEGPASPTLCAPTLLVTPCAISEVDLPPPSRWESAPVTSIPTPTHQESPSPEESLNPVKSASLPRPSSPAGSSMNSEPRRRRKGLGKRESSPHMVARTSTFDRSSLMSEDNPLRGFFTLFWVSMGIYMMLSFIRSWEERGYLFGTTLLSSLTTDFSGLFMYDTLLILGMSPALLFAYVTSRGYLSYRPLELLLQHTYQTTYLTSALYFAHQRQWPWVQTCFFSMHSIVLAMKVHSYIVRNSHLHRQTLALARLEKEEAEHVEKKALSTPDTSPLSASTLLSVQSDSSGDGNSSDGSILGESPSTLRHRPRPRSASDSSPPKDLTLDEELTLIREEIADAREELYPPAGTPYPENITLANWFDYLLVPSLVYSTCFPRTASVRPWYVFEKALATFGSMFLMYVTIEQYLIPTLRDAALKSFIFTLPQLMFPFLITFLLGFYLVFECICNGFAELACYADRRFYDDWWNSNTWDEFARKWNRPVHLFLLHHIYLPLRHGLRLPRVTANFYTFLFSALAHELFVFIAAGRLRMFFFLMQMSQIPMVFLCQQAGSRVEAWGNGFFWVSMIFGPALMTFVYTRDYYIETQALGL